MKLDILVNIVNRVVIFSSGYFFILMFIIFWGLGVCVYFYDNFRVFDIVVILVIYDREGKRVVILY